MLCTKYNIGTSLMRAEYKKDPKIGSFLYLMPSVAGPGGAPGLEDYEPSVRLYTTPRFVKEHWYYSTHSAC
jgi:hypothetical protein